MRWVGRALRARLEHVRLRLPRAERTAHLKQLGDRARVSRLARWRLEREDHLDLFDQLIVAAGDLHVAGALNRGREILGQRKCPVPVPGKDLHFAGVAPQGCDIVPAFREQESEGEKRGKFLACTRDAIKGSQQHDFVRRSASLREPAGRSGAQRISHVADLRVALRDDCFVGLGHRGGDRGAARRSRSVTVDRILDRIQRNGWLHRSGYPAALLPLRPIALPKPSRDRRSRGFPLAPQIFARLGPLLERG